MDFNFEILLEVSWLRYDIYNNRFALKDDLQQPTLILSGNQDPLVPLANAKIMQRLIPHARLYVYKGEHLGLITHSKELAGVIEWFLFQ